MEPLYENKKDAKNTESSTKLCIENSKCIYNYVVNKQSLLGIKQFFIVQLFQNSFMKKTNPQSSINATCTILVKLLQRSTDLYKSNHKSYKN